MTINITDIKYDLYDPETNPNDDIDPAVLDLPPSLKVEQKAITELFEDGFEAERDMHELIMCHTGFEPKTYKYTINTWYATTIWLQMGLHWW